MEWKLTNIKDLYRRKEEFLEKEVTVGGWVRTMAMGLRFAIREGGRTVGSGAVTDVAE